MPKTRHAIRFILNDEDVAVSSVAPDATLLDWLRLERRLRGTKEGCAEGDCGACTVLVGRLLGGKLLYESVNACIRFMGSLDVTHVVTVEHLKGSNGKLHPVQQAMVDFHGSQCGFCTPGFVMSLYALWMKSPRPGDAEIEKALQGNLCRCTGYEAMVLPPPQRQVRRADSRNQHRHGGASRRSEVTFVVAERSLTTEERTHNRECGRPTWWQIFHLGRPIQFIYANPVNHRFGGGSEMRQLVEVVATPSRLSDLLRTTGPAGTAEDMISMESLILAQDERWRRA